jgi:hypothetical protein
LLSEGLVAGDPHAMNFGDLHLQEGPSKNEKAQITVVDLDDSGHAPFLVDFARLLTAIKLSGAEVKATEVWQNYLDGLYGKKPEDVPGFVEDVLEENNADWLEEQKEFVSAKTKNGRLDREALGLKPLFELGSKDQKRAQELIAQISARDAQAVVKDAAFKIKQGGGSRGLLRVWVLVDRDGSRSIEEFKEMAVPATNNFEPQTQNQKARLAQITGQFWGNADPAEYKVVSIPGGDFWLRPRAKYELKFDPDKIDTNKRQKKFDRWSLYIAFVLGRLHGSQAEAAPLKKILQQKGDETLEQLKAFSKAYRQHLQEKLE